MSDVCLEIPQFGTKHSLNVSVSGGLAMWHFFKALKL
jgi:tRNA G18 (ribose-2'-O)-methylase SpoU